MSSTLKSQSPEAVAVESTDLSCFDNQISGHSVLLKGTTSPQHIYKPYDRNEADFYEYILKNKHLALYNFIAPYYGVMLIPKRKLEDVVSKVCKEETSSEDNEESTIEEDIQSPDSYNNAKNVPESVQSNIQARSEWLKELFSKRFNESNTSKWKDFINLKFKGFVKLGDLTSDIENPCMLDLKMGSVAYNMAKLAHQTKKYSKTTSSSLKFRICGLQVGFSLLKILTSIFR